jgi:iron(III) transport system ATP-binding protein
VCSSPRCPATRWVADFVGDANLIRADASGERARSALGELVLLAPHHGAVDVLLRPEHVAVSTEAGRADQDGAPGTVELVEYYGHDHLSMVVLDDGCRVRSRRPGPPEVTRGQRVRVASTGAATVAFAAD